jgi:hypothetical protein
MKGNTAVTIRQTFDILDSVPLFSVNAGVPLEDALERASGLMFYAERLCGCDAFVNKDHETAVVQILSEMARALVQASKGGVSEVSDVKP